MRLRYLLFFFLITVPVFSEGFQGRTTEESRIIYPGKGIGSIRINEPKPSRVPVPVERAFKEGNIRLDFYDNKTVKKITVFSDQFIVAVSALRVERNNTGDVKRFYGRVYPKALPNNRYVFRYPLLGIDFETDRLTERITAISIYMPADKPGFPDSGYRQYREQFKQMKQ